MQPDWNTPAGKALDSLSKAIQLKGLLLKRPILVFGSAPLQIYIAPAFLSADVDVAPPYDQSEEIKKLVDEIGLGKGKAPFYIEVVAGYIFRPGQNWQERTETVMLNGVSFLFPAPLDILLGKLRRLEEKDILAFELVREKTGHPTDEQLILELRASFDQFYIQKNGQKSALWENTEKLWPRLFLREIDARREIIEPVLAELSSSEGNRDYVDEIRMKLGL